MPEDDELDGCLSDVENIEEEQTSDDDIDAVVLFADVDPNDKKAVAKRKKEWQKVFADGV